MRTFEEFKANVEAATDANDAPALTKLASDLEELGTKEAAALGMLARGRVFWLNGTYQQALQSFDQALTLFREHNDLSAIARVHGNIGIVNYRIGNYPLALEYFEKAMMLHQELGEYMGIARVAINIGNVSGSTGNYPKALESYEQALALCKVHGPQSGIANSIGNIGCVYISTGDYPKALDYLEQALEQYKVLSQQSGVALVTGNIGFVYTAMGNYTKALDFFEQSFVIHHELGEQAGLVNATANIIYCLLKLGDTEPAARMLQESEALTIDDPNVRISLKQSHAAILELRSDLEAAHAKLTEALAMATEAGLRPEEASCHERLRDLARKRNDFDGYVFHNDECSKINEEIRGKEATQKLAMMEAEKKIQTERAEREKERALLYSALPKSVADRILKGDDVSGDQFQEVSVLFLDIAGFTALCDRIPAAHVVRLLEQIFSALDKVSSQWGLTKIKTIGDSYMAACGLPNTCEDHAMRTAQAALQMITTLAELSITMPPNKAATTWTNDVREINVRIGLHCGPVTAGVIGTDRLQYDVWGDTVNVASRMESTGEPGRIHISDAFARALEGSNEVTTQPRGDVSLKGKGTVTTFWLQNAN